MWNVEAEAGWLFIAGVVIIHIVELSVCLPLLRERKEARKKLLTHSVLSLLSFCLLFLLCCGGLSPILLGVEDDIECNTLLALYGLVWAGSVISMVNLVERLAKEK